jgi:hypothetical protein
MEGYLYIKYFFEAQKDYKKKDLELFFDFDFGYKKYYFDRKYKVVGEMVDLYN